MIAVDELEDGNCFDTSPAVDGNRLLLRLGQFSYCMEGSDA